MCIRHHCIDWNFVPNLSAPRSTPNRWWAEMNDNGNVWKVLQRLRVSQTVWWWWSISRHRAGKRHSSSGHGDRR